MEDPALPGHGHLLEPPLHLTMRSSVSVPVEHAALRRATPVTNHVEGEKVVGRLLLLQLLPDDHVLVDDRATEGCPIQGQSQTVSMSRTDDPACVERKAETDDPAYVKRKSGMEN